MNEQEILKFWQEKRIFEKSLQQAQGEQVKDFIFYDGPPFATGLPHYGHILASIIKDVIPRYQTMKGRRVPRRWGWDCHGLPVEFEIEKELGLKTKKDIEKFGIEKFNQAAKDSVLRYESEWKQIIPRIGRWVDMENDYKTMDRDYTESVWWVFKTLYDKGLVYEGYKPMHICPRCETTLSNFEVTQNYKEIKDLAVTVKFELIQPTTNNQQPTTYLLAWTTTAWTLPGNVALAVGKDIVYCKIKYQKSNLKNNEFYILAKDRLEIIKGKFEIISEFSGKDLVGKEYKPLFDYYDSNWKIYPADFVTTEEGTGVVHIAPAFGEDDMILGQERKLPFIQHVGMDGKFKPEVKDFTGLQVKPKSNPRETDEKIIKFLGDKVFHKELIAHSYPFCWRCETPLLNYAASSWFVEVVKIKDKLLKNNKKINWVPGHLREGRFGKWLENARDWAVSRSRYWGAPLPVWQCEKCKKVKVVGSIDDIREELGSLNKIFLMRHGEAENNVKNILNSDLNQNHYHLTEKGKGQIENLVKFLKKEKIDLIFSSPFLRTKETAEIIAKVTGIEIIFDERLREIRLGEFEGKSAEDLWRQFPSRESRAENAGFGVESCRKVRERLENFLDEINKKYKNKNIVVVSHGDPIQIFYGITEGLDLLNSFKGWYPDFGSLKIIYSKPVDLHRPYIDEIILKCGKCGGSTERVPEVFDCWFESGSMPYGQGHYPFEGKEEFDKNFPAEFIAEGVDQTRGWFYTLLVLSTALFGKTAYKNVVANGIILAEDGQKMSKRLKNYPDPMEVVEKYGADALRYYLLSSPVVKAENLNFSEKGVSEAHKKVIMRLKNVLAFYKMYAISQMSNVKCQMSEHILDKWILARMNVLAGEITEAMDKYELDKAVRPILDFVEDLSNWYVRRSRERFKSEDNDKNNAVATLHHILIELSKLIAPFMPFVAEEIYQQLTTDNLQLTTKKSVHLENWPAFIKISASEAKLIEDMNEVRKVVSVGLELRLKEGIKVRQPLNSVTVPEKLKPYTFLIKDELNVKDVLFGKEVSLGTEITPELKNEGIIRELIRNIQNLRKKAGLVPQQKIELAIETDSDGEKLIRQFEVEIKHGINASAIEFSKNKGEEIKIEKLIFKIKIKK